MHTYNVERHTIIVIVEVTYIILKMQISTVHSVLCDELTAAATQHGKQFVVALHLVPRLDEGLLGIVQAPRAVRSDVRQNFVLPLCLVFLVELLAGVELVNAVGEDFFHGLPVLMSGLVVGEFGAQGHFGKYNDAVERVQE